MSVIYGPDRLPITAGSATVADPADTDCMKVTKTDMATEGSRTRTVKDVMRFQMSHVQRFAQLMTLLEEGSHRVMIGPSDDYGDCPLLFEGQDTGYKIAAAVAKDYRAKDWGEGKNDEI